MPPRKASPPALSPSAAYTYVRVQDPSECPQIAAHLGEPRIYEVALCLGYVPTVEELAALIAEGDIDMWRIVPHGATAPVGVAIDSHPFGDHELYVYIEGDDDVRPVREALRAMTAAAFAADAASSWVWTALPLPLPRAVEAMLYAQGYEVVRSDTDRGLKKTFGLERVIYEAFLART